MMTALSPTRIVYIVDMVSPQVRQQERKNDVIPTVTKPYPVWVLLPQTLELRNSECSTALETQPNI